MSPRSLECAVAGLKPGERIGDWVIERALGAGGMGSVYLARGVLSSRVRAACKVLHADGAVATRERFIREVDTLAALDHPSIVRVLSGGDDAERKILYLFMDFVEGEDLEKRMQRGPLSQAEAWNIFRQVAGALAHAHGRSVTHRDIKPANIMISADGTARVVDFGIAVLEGRTRLTREGTLPGTLPYVDPVAFQGEKPDPYRADVYALGLCLWEGLTGKQAFPEDADLSGGQALAKMMRSKIDAEALDPGPGFPKELRRLVMRATHPEPEERLSSMAAFVEGLALVFQGEAEISAHTTGGVSVEPPPVSTETSSRTKASETMALEPLVEPPPQSQRRSPIGLLLVLAVLLVVPAVVVVVGVVFIVVGGGIGGLAFLAAGDALDTGWDGPITMEVGPQLSLPPDTGSAAPFGRAAEVAAPSPPSAPPPRLERPVAPARPAAPPPEPAATVEAEPVEEVAPVLAAPLVSIAPYQAGIGRAQWFEQVGASVPAAGHRFVVVNVWVKNTERTKQKPYAFAWSVEDAKGTTFKSNLQCAMRAGLPRYSAPFGIEAGETASGALCFEVPLDAKTLYARFQPDMMASARFERFPLVQP